MNQFLWRNEKKQMKNKKKFEKLNKDLISEELIEWNSFHTFQSITLVGHGKSNF